MIAASSLFTSCIEQVEPAGIETLRDAKAEYLLGVKQLRLAEAEVQKAQATYWQALAAVEQANAAYRDAQTEGQKLRNDMQALLNEAQEMRNEAQKLDLEQKAAEIAAQIDSINAAAELAAVNAQEELANAQEALRVALAAIAADQLKLTDAEALAVTTAIENYEDKLDDYYDAVEALTDAQKTLWNNEYGMGVDGYYQDWIDYYTAEAEKYAEMMENIPTDPDVEAWAAELKKYQDSLDQYKYNRYQVTKDSVDYFVNVYHDGKTGYKDEMKEYTTAWEKENSAPTVVTEPVSPAKDSFTVVEIDPLEWETTDKAEKVYSTFAGILAGDFEQNAPYKAKKPILKVSPGKVDVNNAVFSAKAYLMGDDSADPTKFSWEYKGTKHNISSNYGLVGALAVLKRELVTVQEAYPLEDRKKEMNKADSVWAAHRAILLAGLQNWQPYKDSVAKKAELKKAMEEAQAKYASGENSLIGAIKTFGEEIIEAGTSGVYSKRDSVDIYDAFTAFAAARKAYLDYEEEDPDKDLNYFHYGKNVSPGFEKVEFANLEFKGFQKAGQYVNGVYSLKEGELEDWTGASATHRAYAHVASQLFGASMVPYIDNPADYPYPTTIDGIIALMNNNNNCTAFYGIYKLGKKTDGGEEVLAIYDRTSDHEYVPSEVKDAEDAFKNYEGVTHAEQAFVAIYNSFWGTTKEELADCFTPRGFLGTDSIDTKAGVYTAATFEKDYNIVNFNGTDIIYSDGLGAILQMIDPIGEKGSVQDWNNGGVIAQNYIFGFIKTSDFYKKLKAAWDYDLVANSGTYEKALEVIQAWIDDVDAAFQAVQDNYDANKAKYEQYKKDKKTYDDARKAAGLEPAEMPWIVVDTYTQKYVKNGKWDLSGKALELAQKYFPEFPEKLTEWKKISEQTADQIYHLNTLKETLDAAYLLAVKVKTNTTAESFKTYVEQYGKQRADAYNGAQAMYNFCLYWIEFYTKQLAQYEAGFDPTQLALAEAQHKVEIAEQAVADALAKLKIAEAEYNKVMAAYCPAE